jgi:hypothetical protein
MFLADYRARQSSHLVSVYVGWCDVVLKPDLESVARRNELHAIGNRHAELLHDDEIVRSDRPSSQE